MTQKASRKGQPKRTRREVLQAGGAAAASLALGRAGLPAGASKASSGRKVRIGVVGGGFVRKAPKFERYKQPQWWKTDMLPEPLRHASGHGGSLTFLTHEFIDALAHGRRPAIDIHESLAMTVPGIVAHQSALKGGAQLEIPSFDPKTPSPRRKA